ncbi:hypothetical protein [Thioclava sp.]|uniref:hypothetical protein n=1 Tax=Thioclava sp. TaxID=1933450 RepID=UPI003AA9CE23
MSTGSVSWLVTTSKNLKEKLKSESVSEQPPSTLVLPPVDSGKLTTHSIENFLKLKEEKQRKRTDLKGAAKAMHFEIEKWTKLNPIVLEGRTWAGIDSENLADILGVTTKQVQRISKSNPFRTITKRIGGRSRKLIRICSPADLTNEDFARIMVAYWRSFSGRKETREQFGMLVGLAKDSPRGLAPDIFRTVTENWSSFMAGVHLAITIGSVDGDSFDKDPECFSKKFFHYPSISVMRRFWHVAVEQYQMLVQEKISEGPIIYNNINNIINEYIISSS